MKTDAIATTQPSALEKILDDPKQLKEIPIDIVERLFVLQKEQYAEQARREFNTALNALQGEMTPVRKAGQGAFKGSRFAKAEHVNAMLDPLIFKHGFSLSVSQLDCPIPDHIRFVMLLRHAGGHSETHQLDAAVDTGGPKGGGVKSPLHGMGSSTTYCVRIMKCSVFDVQLVTDDDGHAAAMGQGSEKISEEQARDLESLMDEVKGNLPAFLAFWQVDEIGDLPLRDHKRAVQMLEAKR